MKNRRKIQKRTLKDLNQEELKRQLKYFPKTGNWKWRINKGKIKKGDVAGCLNKTTKRMYIGIGYKMYQISRLAFLYMEGYFPENDVDHINRISTDNRWNNLREVSPQCNSRNCNLSKKNKSKVTGVLWIKRDKKWLADIKINYKKIYIGYFKKKKDAVKARWEAEIKNNWPNCNSNSSAYLWLKKRNLI